MSIQTKSGQNPSQPKPFRMRAESGQAIILIALMMIALLGILGLAIDGGGLFFMWRDVRNASDAAVLAAAYAKCTDGDMTVAGLNAAMTNGFDNNGASNTVQVNNPPTSGDAAGDDEFVQVTINANRPSYFIHLVYRGPLEVTSSSVAYCQPAFDPSKVPGLWAGGTCNNTVNWTGSQSYIEGGMYGNKEVYVSQGTVRGDVEYVETYGRDDGQVDWDPWPVQIAEPKPDPMNLNIGLFEPGGEIANMIIGLDPTAYTSVGPGSPNYNNGTWRPNGQTLRGLYFVTGDADLGTNNDFHPDGASIAATGQIDFNTGSGASIMYYNRIMEPTASGVQYPGILLYSSMNNPCNVSNTNAIIFRGSNMTVRGVIYAPRGNINVSGSSITMYGSIIGDMIDYSGSQGTLIYDPSILPPRPPRINQAE